MELILSDKYQITTDRLNYILQEKVTKKDDAKVKEGYFKNIGYYGKLEHVLKAVIELEIKNIDTVSLAQLQVHLSLISEVVICMVKRLESQVEELKQIPVSSGE